MSGGGNHAHGERINLFDYTEEQLLKENVLTHYQILHVTEFATTDDIKKAYRKASLKYHPDKTGRGEDDYVFLAVKAAYDILQDHAKRQAYDSTVMPFDDAIPPPRATLIQDPMLSYKDEDFYDTFGPVFQRNLRFDARLRPEAKKGFNSSSSKKKIKPHKPPVLGDADTPLDQVHAFYEYWIHFESWRDFSATAADELQIENELENAESRFEKRWLQKEIDKRAKALKKKEMTRIQTLVERAMEADPRLRAERQAAVEAKERAKIERALAEERKKQEAERLKAEELAREELEKQKKAEEKIAREEEKKMVRKERQQLRRMTSSSFTDTKVPLWDDSYDMQQDVDLICLSLDLNQLRELNAEYEELIKQETHEKALSIVKERAKSIREPEQTVSDSATTPDLKVDDTTSSSSSRGNPWTKDELSALAKAVRKYPPGGASRWEQIALFVNNLCKQQNPRTKEECIEKYNSVARNSKPVELNESATTTQAQAVSTSAAAVVENEESEWTAEEDQMLQDALKKFPASLEKNERWTKIAECIAGKSKKQCVQRFKTIREALKNRK